MNKQELKSNYQEIIDGVTERIDEIGSALVSTFNELQDAKSDGFDPVEVYDELSHPEDFDWFTDDRTVSDEEAEEWQGFLENEVEAEAEMLERFLAGEI